MRSEVITQWAGFQQLCFSVRLSAKTCMCLTFHLALTLMLINVVLFSTEFELELVGELESLPFHFTCSHYRFKKGAASPDT